QGYPPLGYNFTTWLWNGSVGVAAYALPFTWLTVSTGGTRAGNLTIEVAASAVRTSVQLVFGGTSGSVVFDGFTYSSAITLNVQVGSHSLVAVPAAGSRWLSTTLYTSSAMQLDLNQSTVVVLPEGVVTTTINVTFGQNVSVTLATTGGSGQIEWSTAAYPNGSVVQPAEQLSGTQYFSIEALPGMGDRFTGWSVSSSSALAVENASALASVVELNSSGTLIAHFAPSPTTTVHFGLVGPGSIEFNAGPLIVANTTNRSVAVGSYWIEFYANSTYQVQSTRLTGNLSMTPRLVIPPIYEYILAVGATGGSVVLQVNSTLPPVRPVTFVSSPWSDFALDLNGTEYTTGSTALIAPGTYSIGPIVLGGCAFAEWVATANLTTTILAPGGVGTLTVSGSGSLYALPVPSCQPLKARAGPSVTFGDAPLLVSFTSTASGGVPPYTAGWQFGDGASSNASNTSHSYTLPGTYTARLTIYDQVGEGYTASWPIAVHAAPSVSLTIAPASATAPAAVHLTASVLGGSPPFQFHWTFGDGTSANGAGALTRQYSAVGNYTIIVTVTDQVGGSDSATGQLTLSAPKLPPAPLTGSLSLNQSSIHLGQSVQLLASANGGTPQYHYVWSGLPVGCPNGPRGGELNCTPAAKGNYSIVAEILDSANQSVNTSAALEVLPAIAHNTSGPQNYGPPPASPWPLVLAIAIAAAAAAAFVSFLIWRRRRGAGSGPEPRTLAPEPPR
ncbi:MAG TPA: PKD domain-containing protein, partial [Thermoplasmata archaeon]|nr:PKD domain-containing protein [Thermoplasmata archaeon]